MKVAVYLYRDPLLESACDPALGKQWGWQVDRVYQDIATVEQKSQPSPDRSQWRQLLADCQTDPVNYLLVDRLEDLGGSVQEVRDRLAQLEALNVTLVAINPADPTTQNSELNPQNSLTADLLTLLHHLQHNQRSRRIRQGHARNRIKAAPPPGKAPYGYRRSQNRYLLDRATAPVVKDFFENFLLYGSLRGAVRYLAKKYGKTIAASTGHRWLTHPVYRGDLEYQTGDVIPNTHPPILSRDEAAQIDRLLRRNRRLPPRTASAPRSLAGLVKCATCQSLMVVSRVTTPRKQQEYLYLRPNACPQQPKCKAIAYEQILQGTIARICVDLPRAVAGVTLPNLEPITQGITSAISGKQAILAQLPPLIETGVLDQETADLRSYTVRAEIAQLQAKLAQLPPANLEAIAQTVSIPQFWLDLSESERRFYFREFLRCVELQRQDQDWQLSLVFIF